MFACCKKTWLKNTATGGESMNRVAQGPSPTLPRAFTVILLMLATISILSKWVAAAETPEISFFTYDGVCDTHHPVFYISPPSSICVLVSGINYTSEEIAQLQLIASSLELRDSVTLGLTPFERNNTLVAVLNVSRNSTSLGSGVLNTSTVDGINVTLETPNRTYAEFLEVDGTPPTITNITVANSTEINGTLIVTSNRTGLSIAINDTTYVIAGLNYTVSCYVVMNNTTVASDSKEIESNSTLRETSITATMEVPLPPLSDGWHEVKIVCFDPAGNHKDVNLSFIVHATKPPTPVVNTTEITLSTRSDVDGCVLFDSSGTTRVEFLNWSHSQYNFSIIHYEIEIAMDPFFHSYNKIVTHFNFLNLSDESICNIIVEPPSTKFIRIRAVDEFNTTSPWSDVVIVHIARHVFVGTNISVLCKTDGMCYFSPNTPSSGEFSGIKWYWKWLKTNGVSVGEVLKRRAILRIMQPVKAVDLVTDDKDARTLVEKLDNKWYMLNPLATVLNLSLTVPVEDSYICAVVKIKNSIMRMNISNITSTCWNSTENNETYYVSCLPLPVVQHTNVVFTCENTTSASNAECALDRVWVDNADIFHYNLTRITFEPDGASFNMSLAITTSVGRDIVSPYIKDDVPLSAVFGTRTQDRSRSTRVGGYAYSRIPVTVRNSADVCFTDVAVPFYSCTRLHPSAECENATIKKICNRSVADAEIFVRIPDAITFQAISTPTSNSTTVEVGKYVYGRVLFLLNNTDTIRYQNVTFIPWWNGWKSAETLHVNISGGGKKTVSVLMKKVLIDEKSLSVHEERISKTTFLREINATLYVRNNLSDLGVEFVKYCVPSNKLPYFTEESANFRVNSQPAHVNIERKGSDVCFIMNAGILVKGENRLLITYPYEKMPPTLHPPLNNPANSSKYSKNSRKLESVSKKVRKRQNPKRSLSRTPGIERIVLKPAVAKNRVVNITVEVKNPYTFTVLDIKSRVDSVPVGWKVSTTPNIVSFIKKNSSHRIALTILIPVETPPGNYSVVITLTGKSQDGIDVSLGNFVIPIRYLPERSDVTTTGILTAADALFTGFFTAVGSAVNFATNNAAKTMAGCIIILLFLKLRNQLRKKGARVVRRYPKLRF